MSSTATRQPRPRPWSDNTVRRDATPRTNEGSVVRTKRRRVLSVTALVSLLLVVVVSPSTRRRGRAHGFAPRPPFRRRTTARTSFSSSATPPHDVDDDDDDDDDIAPSVDVADFRPPKEVRAFGPNGRSSPAQRKAMGRKGTSSVSAYVCTDCGSEFVKWVGRCPTCKSWNTVQEFRVPRDTAAAAANSPKARPTFRPGTVASSSSSSLSSSSWLGGIIDRAEPVRVSDVNERFAGRGNNDDRLVVPDNEELNNVLGGGFMAGSLTLVGGDPGVGKSTLMLQVAAAVASTATPSRGVGMGPVDDGDDVVVGPVYYVSGEESAPQIAARARRLDLDEASELLLLCETDADAVAERLATPTPLCENGPSVLPSLVVVDSVQTMVCDAGGSSSAGGVVQVRECVAIFLRLAKGAGIPVVLIGHVTKSGDVAGPRTVEHMVDAVLYLEGSCGGNSNGGDVRVLRAVKNRFGSVDEVGVYETSRRAGALVPVADPSSYFLSDRRDNAGDDAGCAAACVLEGARPVAAEVQALVVPAVGRAGRRAADGVPSARLSLLTAVLERRLGVPLARRDVYVNVVGGVRLGGGGGRGRNGGDESDLAMAAALVSSAAEIPARADTIFVGEIGLTGELRPFANAEKRIAEARRTGFSRIVTPTVRGERRSSGRRRRRTGTTPSPCTVEGVEWYPCETVAEALDVGLVSRLPPRKPRRKRRAQRYAEDDAGLPVPIIDDDEDDAFGYGRDAEFQ